ncbi:MAG: hypothetical protein R3F49_00900 [Planctomycetota bacterium]
MKALLATSLFLLAAGPLDDIALELSVEAGTKLTKTFTSNLELELEGIDITFTVGGEEHEVESPDVSMTIRESESLTFTDEYLVVDGGRATKLQRHFDELTEQSGRDFTDPDGEDESEEEEGESDLEGQTVILTWDGDAEEWSAAFAEVSSDGDTDLIGEIEDHADLVEFLPEGKVEVGAEWQVPVLAFSHLSSPSGELHLNTPSELEEPEDEAYEAQFEENLAGEITAKLVSVEEGVATIELTLELATHVELEGESEEVGEDMEMESVRAMSFEFELEGALVWNIDAGHAVSLQVGGDVKFVSTQTQSADQGGESLEIVQAQRFSGTLQLAAEFE